VSGILTSLEKKHYSVF